MERASSKREAPYPLALLGPSISISVSAYAPEYQLMAKPTCQCPQNCSEFNRCPRRTAGSGQGMAKSMPVLMHAYEHA